MSLIKILLLVLLSTLAVFPCQSEELPDKLKTIVESYSKQHMFRGNVLVAIDDEIQLNQSSNSLALSARFEIGSIAKQFTTVLVYLLNEKKQIDFDMPISTYVKFFKEAEIGTITIREILEHRSGLPRDFIALHERESNRQMTSEQRRYLLRGLPVSKDKSKQYSNAGFAVLSVIIESITGKTFEDVFIESIAKPLNLFNTGIISEKALITLVKGQNRLYETVIEKQSVQQNYAIGHGAMYSSALDLYLWQQAVINGKILSQNSFNSMLDNNHGLFKYSYNWPGNSGAKGQAITHSGSNEAFVANVSTYLDHKLIVVTLANEKPAYVSSLYNQLANAVLGFEEPLPSENLLDEISALIVKNEFKSAIDKFSQSKLDERWDLPSAVQLNRSGYLYLENGYLEIAENFFAFLTQVYPAYKNGWDSYAEALEANNKHDLAKKIRSQTLNQH